MIICFTGTGNSRHVADLLQDSLGDEIVRFPPGIMSNPDKAKLKVEDGRVIWVLPIHGWGLPPIVAQIIKTITLEWRGDVDHYLVCTCGDDIGYSDKQWRRLVTGRGWKARAAYSVQMPNTYVAMKGFDVDSPEVAKAKLQAVPSRMAMIADAIASDSDAVDVVRGKLPWVKSQILGPLFRRFCYSTRPFHVTDACVGCGKCAHNCPITTIKMVDGHPQWGRECLMCLRCYHCCPQHAVAYGHATDGKGQYLCPGYTLKN